MTDKKFQIRNSTVDFLVFTKQNSKDSIEAVSYTHLTLPTTPYV